MILCELHGFGEEKNLARADQWPKKSRAVDDKVLPSQTMRKTKMIASLNFSKEERQRTTDCRNHNRDVWFTGRWPTSHPWMEDTEGCWRHSCPLHRKSSPPRWPGWIPHTWLFPPRVDPDVELERKKSQQLQRNEMFLLRAVLAGFFFFLQMTAAPLDLSDVEGTRGTEGNNVMKWRPPYIIYLLNLFVAHLITRWLWSIPMVSFDRNQN